jgi:hypothetical protein
MIEPGTLNPGTRTVEGATERAALANIGLFAAAVRERGGLLDGDPVRDAAADARGRYGFQLRTAAGGVVRILMPGVEIAQVRDDLSSQAPCLYVGDNAWWWSDAVAQAAGSAH